MQDVRLSQRNLLPKHQMNSPYNDQYDNNFQLTPCKTSQIHNFHLGPLEDIRSDLGHGPELHLSCKSGVFPYMGSSPEVFRRPVLGGRL